jgi:hypothetical protein
MDWLNTAVAVLALLVSVLAFLRTLFLDQVVADLVCDIRCSGGQARNREPAPALDLYLRHSL